jgi:hypothetical protein
MSTLVMSLLFTHNRRGMDEIQGPKESERERESEKEIVRERVRERE